MSIERNRRDERLCADVKTIGDEILGRTLVDGGLLFRRNGSLKLRENLLNDVALDRKDIRKIALVAFLPGRVASPGIRQLHGDLNFLTALADISFQDEGDA